MESLLPENLRFFTFVISSSLFFFLESFFPFKTHDERRILHISRNLLIAIINAILYGVLFAALVKITISASARLDFGLLHWLQLPLLWNIIITVILLDGVINYWHVLLHKIPWLWRLHLVHHSDSVLDFTTGTRFHMGEMIGSMFFHLPFYFLIGINFDGLIVSQVLLIIFTQLAHANVKIPERLDTFLRSIFITSNLHHVHHSNIHRDTDSNYGTIFSFWDRIFLTYNPRRDIERTIAGLPQYPKAMPALRILALPFESRSSQPTWPKR